MDRMSEDCLYLNIFAPAGFAGKRGKARKLLPVMLWLHGGAFMQGSGNRPEYNGIRLAQRDVIVVSVNYRLGALGWLVSSEDNLYGNYGLMDQKLAMQFVKNNIGAFGGNSSDITLFGESAGALMTSLHMLDNKDELFHKAIMQSNPLGYTFRSVIVADFIGEAFKRAVDCRDLSCLREERVEDLIEAQGTLFGVPRSVGDFFTFGPTLTKETKFIFNITLSKDPLHKVLSKTETNRATFIPASNNKDGLIEGPSVTVSQVLKSASKMNPDMPIIIGTNRNEGELFVHSAFPASMPKPVYWMFVGALFRDSSAKILKHYRYLVDQVELEANDIAQKQLEEEENRLNFLEMQERLEKEYTLLKQINSTRTLVEMSLMVDEPTEADIANMTKQEVKQIFKAQRKKERLRNKLLKEAAKVAVDYRPVMSQIIDDYLFRCPSLHFADILPSKNIFVYRFSQPTHIPGYKECWGKSCHTAELPYVFEAMDVIRSNYSTISEIAQNEHPKPPEYPFTAALKNLENNITTTEDLTVPNFKDVIKNFFGNYFSEDADLELAIDMAERWANFAKTGDPNYEDGVTWNPWQTYKSTASSKEWNFAGDYDDGYDGISDAEYYDTDVDDYYNMDEYDVMKHRKEALEFMKLLSVEEKNSQRTELKRITNPSSIDTSYWDKFWHHSNNLGDEGRKSREQFIDTLQKAQRVGAVGPDLKELIDFHWRPEARLIEEDCTCEMWDRIRYRY
mmetsp:Transcript_15104/g.23448  ORF Transcript_15104/g.23448 Transcript_15104/m.23448 type:complete len:735 (+) Transcript_15104:1-2205(+)